MSNMIFSYSACSNHSPEMNPEIVSEIVSSFLDILDISVVVADVFIFVCGGEYDGNGDAFAGDDEMTFVMTIIDASLIKFDLDIALSSFLFFSKK